MAMWPKTKSLAIVIEKNLFEKDWKQMGKAWKHLLNKITAGFAGEKCIDHPQ